MRLINLGILLMAVQCISCSNNTANNTAADDTVPGHGHDTTEISSTDTTRTVSIRMIVPGTSHDSTYTKVLPKFRDKKIITGPGKKP